eukprot:TRINITY_DN4236_c0_g1_i2.p1 TRINITY_DN4236_c0_g1~~TRINITY_DN4236_c0_g1_i2.p1  ORF type:complete len:410 (+),score=107.82 TRINITY_DN4236_c0_g1_i2:157-1386(+)
MATVYRAQGKDKQDSMTSSGDKQISVVINEENKGDEKETKLRGAATSTAETDGPPRPRGPPQMIPWMDLVRFVGVILVILSHCSGATRSKIDEVSFSEWFSANFFTSIMRPAVPFFFIVSGYIMLHRSESHANFFGKRMPKVLVPLAFWTVYYIGWSKWFLHERISVKDAVVIFFTDLGSNHLWFLYAIVGCYMATPFLRGAFKVVEPSVALGTLMMWFVSDPLRNTVRQMFDLSPPAMKFLEFPHGYIGLYFAGGVLKMFPTLSQRQIWTCAAVYAVTVTWIVVGSTQLLYVDREDFDVYAHQQSFFVAVESVSAFLLLRHIGEQPIVMDSPRFCKLIRLIAEQSFAIYLMHISIVHYTSRHFFNHWDAHAGFSIPLQVFVVLVVAYFLSYFIKKTPVAKDVAAWVIP